MAGGLLSERKRKGSLFSGGDRGSGTICLNDPQGTVRNGPCPPD